MKQMINKLEYSGLMGFLVGIAVAVFALNIYIMSHCTYLVKVNGKDIGYINGKQVIKNVEINIKNTENYNIAKDIKLHTYYDKNIKTLTQDELEQSIRKELNLKVPACVVSVNSKKIALLSNKQEYQRLIDILKQKYLPNYSSLKSVEIKDIKITEKITTSMEYVNQNLIEDTDDVAQRIVEGKLTEYDYKVKEGDNVWKIASQLGIDVDTIQAYNPSIDVNKIKPGQVIKIVKNEPYFNMVIELNMLSEEEVPYTTKEVEDKSIIKGKQVIRQQGVKGLAEVSKKITLVNGNVVDEDLLYSKLLKSPQNKIVAIGTKKPNIVGMAFIRPARGYISSYFGQRWGRMHQGIDIAAPTGTPICAADDGVVVFAGWMSGYGNCVIIDHGSGYKTLYGHASKIYTSEGDKVSKGEKIAAVGSTGRSTGPHLHFEVRKNNKPQNPLKYVK